MRRLLLILAFSVPSQQNGRGCAPAYSVKHRFVALLSAPAIFSRRDVKQKMVFRSALAVHRFDLYGSRLYGNGWVS